MLYAIIAVVVVIVVVRVALAAAGVFSAKSSSSTPSAVTIIPNSTVWPSVASDYGEYAQTNLSTGSSTWTISGTFTSSPGIGFWILSPSEFASWAASKNIEPTAYQFTAGDNLVTGDIATYLAPGTWYFLWFNINTGPTTVEFTSAVVATPS